jgi:hypothetical protein
MTVFQIRWQRAHGGGAPKTRWTGFAFTRYDSKGTGYLEEYIVC